MGGGEFMIWFLLCASLRKVRLFTMSNAKTKLHGCLISKWMLIIRLGRDFFHLMGFELPTPRLSPSVSLWWNFKCIELFNPQLLWITRNWLFYWLGLYLWTPSGKDTHQGNWLPLKQISLRTSLATWKKLLRFGILFHNMLAILIECSENALAYLNQSCLES